MIRRLAALGFLVLGACTTTTAISPGSSPVVRINEPSPGVASREGRNRAVLVGYNARTITTPAAVVLAETVSPRFINLRNRTRVPAGTRLDPEGEGRYCGATKLYWGGGMWARPCFVDGDADGRFEKVVIRPGLIPFPSRIDRPVPYGIDQETVRDEPTGGLKRALVFDGTEGERVKMRCVEYVNSPSDPSLARDASFALPGGRGTVTVEGITLRVTRVTPYDIEYEIVSGAL